MINGQLFTVTFFKDITFGVLFEQIKAKEHLKKLINVTLKQKIQMPLWTIINACQGMVDSDELKRFELARGNKKISSQMNLMQNQC